MYVQITAGQHHVLKSCSAVCESFVNFTPYVLVNFISNGHEHRHSWLIAYAILYKLNFAIYMPA